MKFDRTTGPMEKLPCLILSLIRALYGQIVAGVRAVIWESQRITVADAVAGVEGTIVIRVPTHDDCEAFVVAGSLCVMF